MGMADVIPGVSGGTIALILGIYRKLVSALNDLHLKWVKPLFSYIRSRKYTDFEHLKTRLGTLHLDFLIPLGIGIFFALACGSLVIPELLTNYPVIIRSFFFGLILFSLWIPLRMVPTWTHKKTYTLLVSVLFAFSIGFIISNPSHKMVRPLYWTETVSQGTSLATILAKNSSALPAHRVFWHNKNNGFRSRIKDENQGLLKKLKRSTFSTPSESVDYKSSLKAKNKPYEKLTVPAGTPVNIPQLPHWYLFFCGSIAISAMILPGISGSYILLILGAYFLVLNSIKGTLLSVHSGLDVLDQILPVLTFGLGAIIGLLLFVRILRYALDTFPVFTAGILVGLMAGCLRGLWPFRKITQSSTFNTLPNSLHVGILYSIIAAGFGGIIIFLLNSYESVSQSEESHS